MNILGDFITRVNDLYPPEIDNDQLNSLLTTIKNEGDEIMMKDQEIQRLQAKIEKIEAENDKLREKYEGKEADAPAKKAPAKRAPRKKAEQKADEAL